MTADSDSPTHRQLARRRQADRDFLARLFLLSVDELRVLQARPQPLWRRVALARALERMTR